MSDDNISVEDRRENYFRVSNSIFNCDLSAYEISVYCVLCRFANNTNTESFPGLKKISKMVNVSKPTIIKAINGLVKKGIILKKSGYTGKSNRYFLISLNIKKDVIFSEINSENNNEIVNDAYHGGKGGLPSSKRGLPVVVNDVYPKKTNIKRLKEKDLIKKTIPEFENITLTDIEIQKLNDKFNIITLQKMYEKLSNYKYSSGKNYKSDYHTLIGWVKDAIAEKKHTNKKPSNIDVYNSISEKIDRGEI